MDGMLSEEEVAWGVYEMYLMWLMQDHGNG